MNPKPHKLSDVRNDVRMLCHVSLPASSDLRTTAAHLADRLPPALRRDGVGPTHAGDLSDTLVRLLKSLADAHDEATKQGHLILEHLDEISRAARTRQFQPSTLNKDTIID
jgi:hypothetical protein